MVANRPQIEAVGGLGLAALGLLMVTLLACTPSRSGPTETALDRWLHTLDLDTPDRAVANELDGLRERLDQVRGAQPEARDLASAVGSLAAGCQRYGLEEAAATGYRLAADTHPEDPRWPYLLARIEQRRGNSQAALGRLSQVLEVSPEFVPALLALGSIEADLGNFDGAEARYLEALRLDKSLAAAIAGLGEVALDRGDLDEAEEYFQSALASDPRATAIWHRLSLIYSRRGDLDSAADARGRGGPGIATVEDPLYRWATEPRTGTAHHLAEAQRLVLAGDLVAAEAQLRLAVQLSPENVRAVGNLGAVLARQGRIEEALVQLQRAHRMKPTDPRVLFNLGTTELRLRRCPEAVPHLEEAARLGWNPESIAQNLQEASIRCAAE